MSSESVEYQLVIVEPEDITGDRIQSIAASQSSHAVYLLDDKEASAGGAPIDDLQAQLVAKLRAATTKSQTHHLVTSREKYREGGHMIVHIASAVHGEAEVCVRRQKHHGYPSQDAAAQETYAEVSKSCSRLVDILTTGEDPKTESELEPLDVSVLEFVPGSRLNNAIEHLSLDQYLDVLLQVLDGMEVAHENGLVHRDIKPKNILVDYSDDSPETESKIIDPGLYTKVEKSGRRPVGDGDQQGTVPLPPEICIGSHLPEPQVFVSGAMDIWKFGDLLIEGLHLQITDTDGIELLGPHTALQKKLLTLFRSCKQDSPSLRPTAKELRRIISGLREDLSDEHEQTFYEVTRLLKDKYDPKSRTYSDPETLREKVSDLKKRKHPIVNDPLYGGLLARLYIDASRDKPPTDADQDLAVAQILYEEHLRNVPIDPLRTRDPQDAARSLREVASLRANTLDPDHTHADNTKTWGSTTALLALTPTMNELLRDELTLGEAEKHLGPILHRLQEMARVRIEEGSSDDWHPAMIERELSETLDSELGQFRGLDEAQLLHYRTILYGAMRNVLSLVIRSDVPDSEREILRDLCVSYSDAILLLDEHPTQDFWINRASILRELRDSNGCDTDTSYVDCLQHLASEAPPASMAQSIAQLHQENGDDTSALKVLEAIPEHEVEIDHLLMRIQILGYENPEILPLLQRCYDIDPSDPDTIEALVEMAFTSLHQGNPLSENVLEEGPRLISCIEKLFCINPASTATLLLREINHAHASNRVSLLEESMCREIYLLWRQWDPTHRPLHAFYRVAVVREWFEFIHEHIERVRWPEELPPRAIDADAPATRLRTELSTKTMLKDAATHCTDTYLPAAIEGLSKCSIVRLSGIPNRTKVESGATDYKLSEKQVDGVLQKNSTGYETRNGTHHSMCIPISEGSEPNVLSVEWQSTPDKLDGELVEILLAAQTLRTIILQEKASNLRTDLDTARQIQLDTLPTEKSLVLPGNRIIAGQMEAIDPVGGDGFYWEQLDDHRTFFMISDISGHGLAAAMAQLRLSDGVKNYTELLKTESADSLTNFVNTLNAKIAAYDMNRFATAVFAIYDSRTHTVQFLNFGHVDPILINGATITTPSPDLVPFLVDGYEVPGMIPGQIDLGESGGVALVTDVFVETEMMETKDAAGRIESVQIGIERLTGWIGEDAHLPPEQQVERLFEKLKKYPLTDDGTAVILGTAT